MVTGAVIDLNCWSKSAASSSKRSPCTRTTTDVAFESFIESSSWGTHPLGRLHQSTLQEITDVSRSGVGYSLQKVHPDRLVISAAGSLNHGEIVKLVMESLTSGWDLNEAIRPAPAASACALISLWALRV